MKLTFDRTVRYIPEWNDNLLQPESERIVVEYSLPSSKDWKNMSRFEYVAGSPAPKLIYDSEFCIESTVFKIENLEINGTTIRNGRDLVVQPKTNLLVQEIFWQIAKKMTELEDDKKKLS